MGKTIKKMQTKKYKHYDSKNDIFYIGIKRGPEMECAEVAPGICVELDGGRNVIGIEILHASKLFRSATLKSRIPSRQKLLQRT